MKNLFDVIVLGGGSSQRMGSDKLFLNFGNQSLLARTVSAFLPFDNVANIIVVGKTDTQNQILGIINQLKDDTDTMDAVCPKFSFCIGGDSRKKSVMAALPFVKSEYVLIHDGARPYLSQRLITELMQTCVDFDSAIPSIPIKDSIRITENENIVGLFDRASAVCVQTPQAFKSDLIKLAYDKHTGEATDCSEVFLSMFKSVKLVKGDENNIKITTLSDVMNLTAKVGVGVDFHQLAVNKKFILGGVEIPSEKGMVAHSDGDVLIHAIMDAILSAVGERDIGHFFPDNDEKFRNISSMTLLNIVMDIVKSKNFKVNNLSATVVVEKPRLSEYIDKICDNLSKALSVNIKDIMISATTAEKLGQIGKENGIMATAIVSII